MFTIPGEKEWTIIINSAINDWGAFSYDKGKDVARVNGKVSKSSNSIEAFSMNISNDNLYLGWGDVIVTVPMK